MAVVSIKSLSTESVIGIYPHELEKPQPLVFDVDMETDISAAGESDDSQPRNPICNAFQPAAELFRPWRSQNETELGVPSMLSSVCR